MPEFAVTAIGRDRPGIVAAISGALLELEGNIEDSQMSILRGHFAVMLIVKLPESADAGELEERVRRVQRDLELGRSP
jgi:glycine cleavage system transcriptional repressor